MSDTENLLRTLSVEEFKLLGVVTRLEGLDLGDLALDEWRRLTENLVAVAVRVFLDSTPEEDLRKQVETIVADIRASRKAPGLTVVQAAMTREV